MQTANPEPPSFQAGPTPFEIVRALVEARILIDAFEAGEPPPEFEVAWTDDLEALFDPDAPLPLSLIERSAQAYREQRKLREGW
jgi:hypothetical protein